MKKKSELNFQQFVNYFLSFSLGLLSLLFFAAEIYFTGAALVLLAIFIFEPSFKFLTNLFNWKLNKFWRIAIVLLGFGGLLIIDKIETYIRLGQDKELQRATLGDDLESASETAINQGFGNCEIKLIKMKDHGYSKSFYAYLPNQISCNIDSAPNERSINSLALILDKLKKEKFYKENCPRCSIDIYTNMEALEHDYKIMNWVSLGIDDCSYNKLRHDGKMQRLVKKHLVLNFIDYENDNKERILTYPCQRRGYCEESTEIPKYFRSICNF